MSLTGSLFASVSGLDAQGESIGVLSNNIANLNTTGFKAGQSTFSSLVAGAQNGGGGGGVIGQQRQLIDQQGLIQSTGINSDIAISGNGFFIVRDQADADAGNFFYTRSGSFRQDSRGFFVNSAGFILQAWPLDNNGLLPGEPGNQNTTSNQLLQSLQNVSTREIQGLAFATTDIGLGLNLDASASTLQGAGDVLQPAATSSNFGVSSTDIVVPDAGSGIADTDLLTIAPNLTPSFDFEFGGFSESNDVTGGIFSATSTTAIFQPGATLTEGDRFSITSGTAGTVTFTYQQFNPNPDFGTFNNMQSLADAINVVTGLNARVANNMLYISPSDANESMTFANLDTTDFIANIGLTNTLTSANGNRWNTLDGLATLINDSQGITALVNNASLLVTVDDPLDTVTFSSVPGNNVLTEFGVSATALGPVYDPAGINGDNMASGVISPTFSRNIRVFDSLGSPHDMQVSFVKAGNNKWLVEAFFPGRDADVITNNTFGQVASGTILFNGDGTLRNVTGSIAQDIQVVWANNAEASTFAIDLGTAGLPAGPGVINPGLADGLSQFDGPFTVQFAEQNGAGSGTLDSIEIDDEGFIIANFNNGQARRVFKIPLATFQNANGLSPRAGNVFSQTDGSGEFSLNEVASAGVGTLAVGALENANVELADELTKLIVSQRAFQSNTRVITAVDELLEDLNRI